MKKTLALSVSILFVLSMIVQVPSPSMQTGTVQVVFQNSANGYAQVTFPQAFSQKPTILLTHYYQGTQNVDIGYANVTKTGFGIYWQLSAPATVKLPCNWLAISPGY